MGNWLLGKTVESRERRRRLGFARAKADDRPEMFCELSSIAVVNASELARDEFMEPVSVCG